MDPNETESREYDWAEIEPPVADSFQIYVLVAHVILGVIISVLSFSDGWISWGTGLGVTIPVLLAMTGVFYNIATGINWFRDEFIPYLTRIQMTPEFETDRFLKYRRRTQVFMLLSGYLSVIITQIVWTQIVNFIMSLSGSFDSLLELLSLVLTGMVFLHVVITIIIYEIFEMGLRSVFSDVQYIIEIEDNMKAYFNEQKKKEKAEKEMGNKTENSEHENGLSNKPL